MRFCHSCDCQVPDDVDVCLVCSGPLHAEPRDAGAASAGSAAGWSPDQWAMLAQRTPFDAAPLLDRLAEAHIPFALAMPGDERLPENLRASATRPGGLWVLVPRSEHARAVAIEQRLLVETLPDLPEDFDPMALDEGRCPACETPMAPDAAQCDECGLEIPETAH